MSRILIKNGTIVSMDRTVGANPLADWPPPTPRRDRRRLLQIQIVEVKSMLGAYFH